jgi:mRNA interferase YafQ
MTRKYKVFASARYRRDYKLAKKRGYSIPLLDEVVAFFETGEPLPQKYCDHALSGYYAGHRECHITPDWLLVYKQEDDMLILILSRTGTHSDLF